jgi:hypothetical protein
MRRNGFGVLAVQVPSVPPRLRCLHLVAFVQRAQVDAFEAHPRPNMCGKEGSTGGLALGPCATPPFDAIHGGDPQKPFGAKISGRGSRLGDFLATKNRRDHQPAAGAGAGRHVVGLELSRCELPATVRSALEFSWKCLISCGGKMRGVAGSRVRLARLPMSLPSVRPFYPMQCTTKSHGSAHARRLGCCATLCAL